MARALNRTSSVLHDRRDHAGPQLNQQGERLPIGGGVTERVLLAAGIVLVLCLCASSIGGAQRAPIKPGGEPSPARSPAQYGAVAGPVPLQLARACWLEAGWSLSDCAAITYVLRARAERARWPLLRMVNAYSALDGSSPRAELARSLPDGAATAFSSRENERWTAVRLVAREALAGRMSNPCPRARHWGGATLAPDAARAARALSAGRWRAARCRQQTSNVFYVEVAGKTLAASIAAGGLR